MPKISLKNWRKWVNQIGLGIGTFSILPGFGDITQTRVSGSPTSGAEEGNTILNGFWDRLMNFIFLAIGIVAVINLVMAGIRYASAANNPEQAKAARTTIIHSVIGIVILVCAYYVIRLFVSIGTSLAG